MPKLLKHGEGKVSIVGTAKNESLLDCEGKARPLQANPNEQLPQTSNNQKKKFKYKKDRTNIYFRDDIIKEDFKIKFLCKMKSYAVRNCKKAKDNSWKLELGDKDYDQIDVTMNKNSFDKLAGAYADVSKKDFEKKIKDTLEAFGYVEESKGLEVDLQKFGIQNYIKLEKPQEIHPVKAKINKKELIKTLETRIIQ